jgi:hypothetical protein
MNAKYLLVLALVILGGAGFYFLMSGQAPQVSQVNQIEGSNSSKIRKSIRITTLKQSYVGQVRLSFKPEMSQAERIQKIGDWKSKTQSESNPSMKEELNQEAINYFESLPEIEERSLRYNMAEVLVEQKDQTSIKKLAALMTEAKEDDINFILSTVKLINKSQVGAVHEQSLQVAKEVFEENKQYILDDSIKNLHVSGEKSQAGLVNDSQFYSAQLKDLGQELGSLE